MQLFGVAYLGWSLSVLDCGSYAKPDVLPAKTQQARKADSHPVRQRTKPCCRIRPESGEGGGGICIVSQEFVVKKTHSSTSNIRGGEWRHSILKERLEFCADV